MGNVVTMEETKLEDQASPPNRPAGDPMPEWMRAGMEADEDPPPDDRSGFRPRPRSEPTPPQRRRRLRWPSFLMGVVVAIGAVAVDRSLRHDTAASLAPVAPAARPVAGPAPITGDPNEPVSAVADVLSPSVVQIETGSGLGSGVVYDPGGLILTAAHVVDGAQGPVTVRLADGERLVGRVVGTHGDTDVAVIEVDRDGLEPATLAVDRPVRVGQVAVAIGSPFGLEGSVTAGIVSAVDRSIATPGGSSASMIQTDASINPGNSGGALADAKGRVIGINDAIRSDSGVNAGVGFAIPIDVAVTVADALLRGVEPEFGFLGIAGTDPSSGPAGALVTRVTPGSAADGAGLQEGDVITSFEGTSVEGMSELASRIRSTRPGDAVELVILRGGDRLRLQATIGSR